MRSSHIKPLLFQLYYFTMQSYVRCLVEALNHVMEHEYFAKSLTKTALTTLTNFYTGYPWNNCSYIPVQIATYGSV